MARSDKMVRIDPRSKSLIMPFGIDHDDLGLNQSKVIVI
jgi:hypothetical protein